MGLYNPNSPFTQDNHFYGNKYTRVDLANIVWLGGNGFSFCDNGFVGFIDILGYPIGSMPEDGKTMVSNKHYNANTPSSGRFYVEIQVTWTGTEGFDAPGAFVGMATVATPADSFNSHPGSLITPSPIAGFLSDGTAAEQFAAPVGYNGAWPSPFTIIGLYWDFNQALAGILIDNNDQGLSLPIPTLVNQPGESWMICAGTSDGTNAGTCPLPIISFFGAFSPTNQFYGPPAGYTAWVA